MSRICHFVVWVGPYELLKMHIDNHRKMAGEHQLDTFVFCHHSMLDSNPIIDEVTYITADDHSNLWNFAWSRPLPDSMIAPYDYVMFNQCDQFWSCPIADVLNVVAPYRIVTRYCGEYWSLKHQDISYHRVWEGGTIAKRETVQAWQNDGILMSENFLSVQGAFKQRNKSYAKICELAVTGTLDSSPEDVCHDYVGQLRMPLTSAKDLGTGVQLWCVANDIEIVSHTHTVHYDSTEMFLSTAKPSQYRSSLCQIYPQSLVNDAELPNALADRPQLRGVLHVMLILHVIGMDMTYADFDQVWTKCFKFIDPTSVDYTRSLITQTRLWCDDTDALKRLDDYSNWLDQKVKESHFE